jgi:hypothetical protein
MQLHMVVIWMLILASQATKCAVHLHKIKVADATSHSYLSDIIMTQRAQPSDKMKIFNDMKVT